jgi:hypothetical protein
MLGKPPVNNGNFMNIDVGTFLALQIIKKKGEQGYEMQIGHLHPGPGIPSRFGSPGHGIGCRGRKGIPGKWSEQRCT